MNRTICVYSSSSSSIDRIYFNAANELGIEMALRNDSLIYGGGMTGLMGETARAVHSNNGRVIGVIPEALNVKGVVYDTCDELVITKGMRERKGIMDSRANAFIALPGGYGTLEEVLEIITLKQLKYHNKPIVILNINGFYDKLIGQFDDIINGDFAKPECRELYYVTSSVKDALDYIDNYIPFEHEHKWLTDVEAQ